MPNMNTDIPKIRRLIRAVLLRLLMLVFYLGFMEVTLRLGGYEPWQIYQPIFPNMPRDQEFDPELGWRNKPGQFVYPGFEAGQVITLTHAADGTRVTSYHPVQPVKGSVWVVGNSFVQGMAISDEETFAWKLQEALPDIQVRNLAVAGYGTYQSMLMVERHLAQDTPRPQMVIYGFNDFHEMRNTASFIWLRGITINSTESDKVSIPYATVENGRLVRHPPDRFAHWPWREKSALITALEDVFEGIRTWRRTHQEREVTRQILLTMRDELEAQGIHFLVVFLAAKDESRKADYLQFFQEQHLDYLDCTHPRYGSPEMSVPLEGHPNGKLNSFWAQCILQHPFFSR